MMACIRLVKTLHTLHGKNVINVSRKRASTVAANFSFDVSKFGELSIRTESVCNVNIDAVNGETCVDQNRAYVDVIGPSGSNLPVTVSCKSHNILSVCAAHTKSTFSDPINCFVKVPYKYNVNVEVAKNKEIFIKNLQSDLVAAVLDSGKCTVTDLQTGVLSITTNGGQIVSEGLLQGSSTLTTKSNGAISIQKILSDRLNVESEKGDIHIKSLYADKSRIVTRFGSVNIGNAHRGVHIEVLDQGNVNIGIQIVKKVLKLLKLKKDSLDGDVKIDVKNGDVSLFACRHGAIEINVNTGNVTLMLPKSVNTRLDLNGNQITIDDQLQMTIEKKTELDSRTSIEGILTSAERIPPTIDPSTIKIEVQSGNIHVVVQEWIQSLRLKKLSTSFDYD